LVTASDLGVELVNFAGKSVGWKPLGHRVRIDERPVNSLRCRAEHSMKPDSVCVIWHNFFAFWIFHYYDERGLRLWTSVGCFYRYRHPAESQLLRARCSSWLPCGTSGRVGQ